MHDAIDNLTNLRIDAQDAERGDFSEHYRCPECHEAVIFAGGTDTYQRAHFRHLAGDGHFFCNRYVAGGGGGIAPPFYERDSVSRAYNIVCGTVNQQKVFFGIRVLLTTPAKEIAIFQSGKKTKRHVADARPIAWITHPQASYYLTIGFGNGGERSVETEGFVGEKNIFQATGQLGALVTRSTHLQSGDYYILQKGQDLSLPAGFNLQRLQFRDADNFRGWSVFSFSIPEEVTEGARSWFTGATGYLIGRHSAKCAILQPQAVYGLGNASWQIEAGVGWTVLAKFPSDYPREINLYVQRRSENLEYTAQETRFDISETDGLVLVKGSAEHATEGSVYRIAIRRKDGVALLVELSCVRAIHEPQCDRLAFIVDNKRFLWSSHVLSRTLVKVREGGSRLTKIEIPAGLSVTVRADGKAQRILDAFGLVAFLKSTKSSVSIHAEGHGSIQIKGVVIRKFSRRNDCGLSLQSRSEDPLADAYMRGQASEYAASVTSDGNH
jgi:hypothetical protein